MTGNVKIKKLRVFDFDDVLVKTQGKVRVNKQNGEVLVLTPGEYAVYEKQPGDELDYSDFRSLKEPEEIKWMTNILKNVIAKRGTDAAMVLTARGTREPIKQFFKMFGIPEIPIVALNDSHPDLKAQWVLYMAKKYDYDIIEFFDDSPKYIAAVQAIAAEAHPVKIITRLIQHRAEESSSEDSP
jgi:hypothetical protein